MKIKECAESRFVIIRKLFARECHAHIIVISKRAAVITTSSHTDTHTLVGIRIFNIRSANFSLLFARRASGKNNHHFARLMSAFVRIKVAGEKILLRRNYCAGLHSWGPRK